jgi:DMSO/TMAO reductase YedYZ molybdopterin-dependent catalytic subunit
MFRVSRRDVLKLLGVAGLTAAWHPHATSAGVLDYVFGMPEARVPLPITPNDRFYLTSYRSPPSVRLHTWQLVVKGVVGRPLSLTYEDLIQRPSVSEIVTLECVGNSVGGEFISTAEWKGIPLKALLEETEILPVAYDVVFRAADDYSDAIRLDRAMAGDVLVAYKMNGVSLPLAHGFPVRIIVPGAYGMKSVQWLTEIEAVDRDYKGYYQQKGWTDEATVKSMSRIDLPGHGSRLKGSDHLVQGLAFAGIRGVSKVEVSVDEGKSWHRATLHPPLSASSWVFWHWMWHVPQPARYTLMVRATDGTGKLQTSEEAESAPEGASGLHQVTATVEES